MPRAFEPIAWLAGRPAPHLRLLEPVGLRAGRARRGACARAQMVHVVRHAIGATTLASARDCVACANSSSAPAQLTRHARMDHFMVPHGASQNIRTDAPRWRPGVWFFRRPTTTPGVSGEPRRADAIIRAIRRATRTNPVLTPSLWRTTKTICAIGVSAARTPGTLARQHRVPKGWMCSLQHQNE